MPRRKKTKKFFDIFSLPITIMVLLVVLTFIFICSSSLYAIYYARVVDPYNQLLINQIILNNRLVQLQEQINHASKLEQKAIISRQQIKEEMVVSEDVIGRHDLSNKGDMQFKSANFYRGLYTFSGKITVTGRYIYYEKDAGILNDIVCLDNIRESDVKKFPKFADDERDVWFCFSNQELAKKLFGPEGSSGQATIEIDNYTIDMMESEVWNTAELIRVINKN